MPTCLCTALHVQRYAYVFFSVFKSYNAFGVYLVISYRLPAACSQYVECCKEDHRRLEAWFLCLPGALPTKPQSILCSVVLPSRWEILLSVRDSKVETSQASCGSSPVRRMRQSGASTGCAGRQQ